MDLSGFFLSGGGDDDNGQELSGTLFSKKRDDTTLRSPEALYQGPYDARTSLRRSMTQHPPPVSPYRLSSLTNRTFDQRASRGGSLKSALGRNLSTNSQPVTPLTPSVYRRSTLNSRPAANTAPPSPRDLMRNSAVSRSHFSTTSDRASQDIMIFLDLASPRLPPPLETPTTPEDYYTHRYDFDNSSYYSTLSPTSETRPTTSEGFYQYRLSSTTNVAKMPALKSRAETPSGAWRFDVVSHQDGLRMHHHPGYSAVDVQSDVETATPLQTPYLDATEPKIPLMTHENRSLTDTLDLKDTKPINFTPNPSPSIPSNKFTLGIIACFGQAIVAMVLIQALIPARTIGESLSEAGVSEPGELMWLTAACIITASAFTLPAARITDYIGTRKAYIGSMMWLMIWTELAAFGGHVQRAGSSGLTFISVCRAMQGIGIAFLGPMCCDMLQQMYPSAFTSALIAISGVVGAVIGGIITCAFASGSNWKWSFVLLSVICIALAVLGLLVLPRMQRQSHDSRHGSLWTHLDALGMFSGGAGVVLFTIGLNLLSLVSPGKPYPYLMMVVGLILFAWFLFTERSALSPVLPFASITTRAYIVLACLAIYWGALTVWLWYLVQILEHIREWKPILISAGLIPMLIIGIGGAFGTRFAIRIASSEVVMFSTAGLSFIGYVVMATAENEIYWRSPFFSILLASPGTVMFTLSAMRLLSDNVAPRFPSSLTALAFAIVAFGMSVALGFAGTIERAINGGDEGQLTEYRGGQYVGLSLSALVLVLSLSLLISGHLRR